MAIQMIHLVVLALVLCCTIADKCPKSCDCDSLTRKVVCEYFWNKLPPLPKGTLHLEMRTPFVGELAGPESCAGYSNLTVLLISSDKITSISKDALHCIPALQTLKVSGGGIEDLHWDTFKHTHHLKQMHLGIMLSTNVLPKLCMITSLEIIELVWTIKTNQSLDCLGSLPLLSDVKIQGVKTTNLGELVKPFRNLTNSIAIEYCHRIGLGASLRENTLDGFKVQFLSFRETRIYFLRTRTFKYLSRLKILDLSGAIDVVLIGYLTYNYMPEIRGLSAYFYWDEVGRFQPLNRNISDLSLSNIGFIIINEGCFVDLIYLSVLNLQSCKITEIDENAFRNLPKLESLIMSNNNIQNFSNLVSNLISKTAFPHKHLDLSGNPLHNIERPSENLGFLSLEILHLNNSKIKRIEAGAFDIFTNLKELDVAGNYLQELSPNMFQKLKFLEKLDLSRNFLVKLDTELYGLQNNSLVELYLQENRLQAVSIWNITTLETLNVGKNIFHELELNIQGPPSLKKLYADNIRISRKRTYRYCEPLSRLVYADISEPFTVIQQPYVNDYVESQTCSLNVLMELKQTGACRFMFGNYPQLRILHINKCSPLVLYTKTFSYMPNLRKIDASSNYLTVLNPKVWNVSRLENLNLNDNLISQLNWTFFIHLKHLRFLHLENNPLVCTCDVLFVLQAIRSPSMTLTIPSSLRCASPEDVRGFAVRDLPLSLEQCEDRWASISGYALLCPVIIVIIYTVINLWRLRWHIKYTFFLAKAGVGRYAEQCDGKDYLFDAFLAYSEKDLKWVTDQLLKNMDTEFIGEEGLNMCLHHRDWLAGIEITENIRRSIAASRRTIVILSKEFASSYWCRFELAMAHMNLEADKSGRLLVILLEQIPDELLCPHIVHILTTKTYLAFPKDEALQKHFWKALRKSMKKEVIYQ